MEKPRTLETVTKLVHQLRGSVGKRCLTHLTEFSKPPKEVT